MEAVLNVLAPVFFMFIVAALGAFIAAIGVLMFNAQFG